MVVADRIRYRDKKIRELEQKLARIETNAPAIGVRALGEDGTDISSKISFDVVTYADGLTTGDVENLVAEAQKRWPLKTDFGINEKLHLPYGRIQIPFPAQVLLGGDLRAPYDWEISKYSEERYPEWVEKVQKFFNDLPSALSFRSRHLRLSFVISNSGSVPADHAVIEFQALAGFLLASKNMPSSVFDDLKLPQAPSPPKPTIVEPLFSSPSLGLGRDFAAEAIRLPRPRDRNAFYVKEPNAPPYSDRIAFECDEFRHQVESKRFDVVVFIPPKLGLDAKGAIKCIVTAKNLPTPVEKILNITVDSGAENCLEFAWEILSKASTDPTFSESD